MNPIIKIVNQSLMSSKTTKAALVMGIVWFSVLAINVLYAFIIFDYTPPVLPLIVLLELILLILVFNYFDNQNKITE